MVLLTEIMTVPIQAVNLESDQIDIGSCRIGDLDRIKALINIVEDYLVFQKKISSKEIGFVLHTVFTHKANKKRALPFFLWQGSLLCFVC